MDAPPVQYAKTRDGFDIAYMVSGEGQPLLLLPNAWSHIQLFWRTAWRRSLFEALSARFRLIQFDARGQGLSTRGLGPGHSRESYCLDLEAVVDQLGLDRFVLFARNLFCQVAVEYALKNQGRLDALILSNPAARLYQGFEGVQERQWHLYTETIARLTNLPGDPASIAEQFRLAVNQADQMQLIEALTWDEIPSEVAGLQIPTLVFDSSTSPLSSQDSRLSMAAAIPNARLVTLNDSSTGFFSSTGTVPPAVPIIVEFLESVRGVAKQGMLATPDLIAGVPSGAARSSVPLENAMGLSPREREVLRLIAAGKSNPQIAQELVISLNTVQRHVSNILAKTGAANRTEAALYTRDN